MGHVATDGGSPVRISAIVCSCGSRSTLPRTVRALAKQTFPAREYELVVVINVPDAAQYSRTVDELRSSVDPGGMQMRFVHEPRLGLSFARNTGIRAARGEYIAYTDDDGLPEPCWLERITAVFDADPQVGSVGGNIIPLFEDPLPQWLTPHLYTYLSCRIFGREEAALPPGHYFFGANMAFRRQVLENCGGFDTQLGRKGAALLSNEEWTVYQWIDEQGLQKVVSPEASVQHIIPASRLRRRFFARRLWWQGISDTVFHLCVSGKSKGWVLSKARKDFADYYGTIRQKFKADVSTPHLAFFNIFRWVATLYALCVTPCPSSCEQTSKGSFDD